MIKFSREFQAGWADMDYNGHMGNTSYLNKAADTRMLFFDSNGFTMKEFTKLRIGPVIMKDELEYFREFKFLDKMDIVLEAAGLSNDGSRFKLINTFFTKDEKLAVKISSMGGWLNLETRKLVKPPLELLSVMNLLTKTSDFIELPSSIKV